MWSSWDIIARYGPAHPFLPMAFYSDFVKVALDESKHFSLLSARLDQMGSHYGALSVHAGLWDSAWETRSSVLARLAIIHLVHEARGLDVNPVTIAKFKNAGEFANCRTSDFEAECVFARRCGECADTEHHSLRRGTRETHPVLRFD